MVSHPHCSVQASGSAGPCGSTIDHTSCGWDAEHVRHGPNQTPTLENVARYSSWAVNWLPARHVYPVHQCPIVASKSPSCLGQAHFSHENGQATSLAERSGYWISYTESDIAAYEFNSYEVMNNYDMIHGDFCRAFPACQNLAVQSIATGLATS